MNQLSLFAAAPIMARPAQPDTAMLLAMSPDYAIGKSASTNKVSLAYQYISESRNRGIDDRDIIKGLIEKHGAKLSYPSYRTALRCCDLYMEAATSCALATAKLLLDSFAEKADKAVQI